MGTRCQLKSSKVIYRPLQIYFRVFSAHFVNFNKEITSTFYSVCVVAKSLLSVIAYAIPITNNDVPLYEIMTISPYCKFDTPTLIIRPDLIDLLFLVSLQNLFQRIVRERDQIKNKREKGPKLHDKVANKGKCLFHLLYTFPGFFPEHFHHHQQRCSSILPEFDPYLGFMVYFPTLLEPPPFSLSGFDHVF